MTILFIFVAKYSRLRGHFSFNNRFKTNYLRRGVSYFCERINSTVHLEHDSSVGCDTLHVAFFRKHIYVYFRSLSSRSPYLFINQNFTPYTIGAESSRTRGGRLIHQRRGMSSIGQSVIIIGRRLFSASSSCFSTCSRSNYQGYV